MKLDQDILLQVNDRCADRIILINRDLLRGNGATPSCTASVWWRISTTENELCSESQLYGNVSVSEQSVRTLGSRARSI